MDQKEVQQPNQTKWSGLQIENKQTVFISINHQKRPIKVRIESKHITLKWGRSRSSEEQGKDGPQLK